MLELLAFRYRLTVGKNFWFPFCVWRRNFNRILTESAVSFYFILCHSFFGATRFLCRSQTSISDQLCFKLYFMF